MFMGYFLSALVLSMALTLAIRKIALKLKIVDFPDESRKLHNQPAPLLGGIAIFLSFWILVGCWIWRADLPFRHFSAGALFWVFAGSLLLMVMGFFDDQRRLSPWPRLLISSIVVFMAIMGGVGLSEVTNPFGGLLRLDFWQFRIGGLGTIVVLADLLVFFWLMSTMYTTKILDGLDGLSAGISAIGGLMIFFLASTKKFYQPDAGILALIFTGACLGFLLFNFHPAKIFLGEGGGLFVGFILGVLAVIAGGKVATALLVLAVPIFDLARVVFVRAARHRPFFKGDREHLHFRLLEAGWGQRKAVLFYYAVALIFGLAALFLQSREKLYTLILLLVGLIVFSASLKRRKKDEA